MINLLLFERRKNGSPNKGSFSFYNTVRETYTPFYEKKGCVYMLYIIMAIVIWVGLTKLDELNLNEEFKKAEVEGYELTIINE